MSDSSHQKGITNPPLTLSLAQELPCRITKQTRKRAQLAWMIKTCLLWDVTGEGQRRGACEGSAVQGHEKHQLISFSANFRDEDL